MNITLSRPRLFGTVAAIPSKSHVHRLLICASLADTPSVIRCPLTSDDIDATVRCMTGLGAVIDRVGEEFHVTPIPGDGDRIAALPDAAIDCGESGSTMRFLVPVVCALGKGGSITSHGRLPERPLSPLYEELVSHGALLSPAGTNPFCISGTLTPGDYTLDGSVSSQFISGLLFALPLLDGPSTLTITGKLESAPYITLTLQALEAFGVHWQSDDPMHYRITPTGYASPGKVNAEGDWSNGAFWLAAGALSEAGLTVTGLSEDSVQGDSAILPILERMGAQVIREKGRLTVSGGHLHGTEIDGAQIPDLVPVLSVAAAAAEGETIIRNIGRLRLKESDRIASVTDMLTSLGCIGVTSGEDWLKIPGGGLTGGTVQSWNDHRIAMSAGIASTVCKDPVTITGAEAVRKSYPTFFDDLDRLTAKDFICTMQK
ncbi:MAG: 3-phosphoshikimate 1-carboxyvinyltransferase [Clostridia bacterium]|nr:3-phosphoshikimate 1-carboxyvinyltransferase [Clostridia bacterium]